MKKLTAWLWLLLIPAKIVLDQILLRAVAAWEIAQKQPGTPGHPSGMITFGFWLLAALLTLLLAVFCVVRVRRALKRLREEQKQTAAGEVPAWDPEREK